MDGTLLDAKKEISPSTVEMIRKANENGIEFMITTGREYEMVKDLLDKNKLKCSCILMNGAEYRDINGIVLGELGMDANRARRIIEILQKEKIVSRIYTEKGVFTLESREDALQEMTYRAKSFFPELSEEESVEKALHEPFFLALQYVDHDHVEEFLNTMSIKKFVAFHKDVDLLDKTKKILREIPNIAVSSSFRDNMELTDVRAQKGLVLKKVILDMGLKEEEVMVMGDSFNDETMFLEFTHSVAMGNAIDEIKAMAKYITKRNDEDGVAFAMKQVLDNVWGQ